MIISRTPYRVSFFGGGTDYPTWFEEHGGAVLASTINRYCYITCRFLPAFFEHHSRVVWSEIEKVASNSEINHPAVRAGLEFLGIDHGVEIHHDGDLPSRSGLGSSSAFTVGLLNSLHALRGSHIGKTDLAEQAIYLEQKVIGETVGVQDQIETAFGGINRIDIGRGGDFSVRKLILNNARVKDLESHLLLFFTGVARTAEEIAKVQVNTMHDRQNELKAMLDMVDEAEKIITGTGDISDFGRLLHESWMLKRSLTADIAPDFVNDIYQRGLDAGAQGGKLLGAGGGGFMLFFVPPDKHLSVAKALDELLLVPFEFENSGSQILVYEPDHYSRLVMAGQKFKTYETTPAPVDNLVDWQRSARS